jgi:hypothetical protein
MASSRNTGLNSRFWSSSDLPPKRSRLRTQKFEQPVAWEVVELSDEDDDKVEVDNQLNLASPAPATSDVRSTHPGI